MDDSIVATDPKATAYANTVQSVVGMQVQAVTKDDGYGIKKSFLVIPLGDANVAEATISKLAPLREKAGLSRDDFSFQFDHKTGDILIGVENFEINPAALQAKLASVKNEFTHVFDAAKAEVAAAAASPHLTEETSFTIKFASEEAGSKMKRIKDGDFSQLPPEVIEGALAQVPKIRQMLDEHKDIIGSNDPAKIKQFEAAANIDGDKTTLTDKELAAWLLAKSMGPPDLGMNTHEPYGSTYTQVFDNKLTKGELLGSTVESAYGPDTSRGTQDQALVFETARQIFGDAMKGKIGGGVDTTTPEGNKLYFDAVDNSKNTGHSR